MSPVSPLARFAGSIYHWARDHRVHHKHSEQDADPHNATRGLFFAHMGWLYVKKHPAVVEAGKLLNFDDLKADGTVMFQKRYDPWFTLFMCFVFPALVAKYCWGEEFWPALHVAGSLRVTSNNKLQRFVAPQLASVISAAGSSDVVQVQSCSQMRELLFDALEAVDGTGIAVGAQDVSLEESGAFTGEVAASMVRSLGCDWALVGHSERRTLYDEGDEIVVQASTWSLSASGPDVL